MLFGINLKKDAKLFGNFIINEINVTLETESFSLEKMAPCLEKCHVLRNYGYSFHHVCNK